MIVPRICLRVFHLNQELNFQQENLKVTLCISAIFFQSAFAGGVVWWWFFLLVVCFSACSFKKKKKK